MESPSTSNFAKFSFGKEMKRPKLLESGLATSESIGLSTINSKIHKLREDINRELDFIH